MRKNYGKNQLKAFKGKHDNLKQIWVLSGSVEEIRNLSKGEVIITMTKRISVNRVVFTYVVKLERITNLNVFFCWL